MRARCKGRRRSRAGVALCSKHQEQHAPSTKCLLTTTALLLQPSEFTGTTQCVNLISHTYIEDVNAGLVDGAHDGAPGVDGVAHSTHHNGGGTRVQSTGGPVGREQR